MKTKTRLQQRFGYAKRFKTKYSNRPFYNVGDILELHKDDGSTLPEFLNTNDGRTCYVSISAITPLDESTHEPTNEPFELQVGDIIINNSGKIGVMLHNDTVWVFEECSWLQWGSEKLHDTGIHGISEVYRGVDGEMLYLNRAYCDTIPIELRVYQRESADDKKKRELLEQIEVLQKQVEDL